MAQFRELSGDANPVHHDASFARDRGFDGPIVYGNILGLMVSRLVGMELPTAKVVILRQSLEFRRPAYVGEELRLRAEVTAVHEAVQVVQLKLGFHSSSTDSICTGQCLIKCL
jgi:3-hydroxybutyryl-CoA dehydratase